MCGAEIQLRFPRKAQVVPRDLIDMVAEVLGDRYSIESEIGRGGAARVFRAHDRDGRLVALKVLRPELLASLTARRFLREISVLARLNHPHIAGLLDYGEADWLVYYVMVYAEGPTLREWLREQGKAPVHETLCRSCEVLDAIAHAHEQGIVHRDVKPENVILTANGAVLLDFGIARAIEVSEEQKVTRSGFTVGTSAYMSPEQAMGEEIDHRADLYSLGCVIYECLAGRPPYEHPLDAQVMHQHQRSPIPDILIERADVPAKVASVIEKALAKNPSDRWQTASAMRSAIAACM